MVDRVELDTIDEVAHVGRLDDSDDRRCGARTRCRGPRRDVGHVGEHVVRVQHRRATDRRPGALRQAPGRRTRTASGRRVLDGHRRNVLRGVDAEHRHAATSRSGGGGSRRCSRSPSRGRSHRVPTRRTRRSTMIVGVRDDGVGIRGEVRVLLEEHLRRHRHRELHEACTPGRTRRRAESGLGHVGGIERPERVRERLLPRDRMISRSRRATGPAHDGAHWIAVRRVCSVGSRPSTVRRRSSRARRAP